jgi:hypothetical protein
MQNVVVFYQRTAGIAQGQSDLRGYFFLVGMRMYHDNTMLENARARQKTVAIPVIMLVYSALMSLIAVA